MPSADPHDLARFVAAHEGTYDRALAEIRDGRKVSHWMWFIFPQVAGLGFSETSRHFAIRTRAQARAYLTHPLLGQRLTDCAQAAAAVPDRTAMQVFGSPDDLKLHSSATLFASLSPAGSVFQLVLERYFGSQPDLMTLRLLDALPADE